MGLMLEVILNPSLVILNEVKDLNSRLRTNYAKNPGFMQILYGVYPVRSFAGAQDDRGTVWD